MGICPGEAAVSQRQRQINADSLVSGRDMCIDNTSCSWIVERVVVHRLIDDVFTFTIHNVYTTVCLAFRDMFVDASMKPHLHHRRMLDALMDETDLVSHYC